MKRRQTSKLVNLAAQQNKNRFVTYEKYLNTPRKVAVSLFIINYVFGQQLSLIVRYFLSPDTILGMFDTVLLIRFFVFILATFLTSIIYVKATMKAVDKDLKIKVSLYFAIGTFIIWMFFTFALGEIFVKYYGNIFDGIIQAIISFVVIYLVLPLGNRFLEKKK